MIRHLITVLAIAALTMISPESARADTGDVTAYATVDAIEAIGNDIFVTGIIAGQGAPSTTRYDVFETEVTASRCDRMALLAMSKPGKFQFVMVEHEFQRFACKLILRTP
jgi:hypothetical protein